MNTTANIVSNTVVALAASVVLTGAATAQDKPKVSHQVDHRMFLAMKNGADQARQGGHSDGYGRGGDDHDRGGQGGGYGHGGGRGSDDCPISS